VQVLFTSTPGRGHVHPMVPLARAFLDRGDDVLWATGPDVCPRLEQIGIRTAPAGMTERDSMAELGRRFPEIQDLPPPRRPEYVFPRLFGSVRAAPMLADLVPVARSFAPSLVVHDAGDFAGPIAAAVVGVRSVVHSFGALLPEPRVAAAGAEVAPLWVAHGLEPRPHGGCYGSLYLDIYPPSLQTGERPHVPASQLLRPEAFATDGDEDLPDLVTAASPAPLVYVTFGTVFSDTSVLETVVAGLRELAVRVVATVGPHGDPAALGAQPDHVHVARYIPQALLLSRCEAVVSHAGSGTFLAALSHGLPQLCLPLAADQFANAAAGVRSGASLAIEPGAVTADGVRVAVERLLSEPAFRSAAEAVSREIAAMPSSDDVAERLHGLQPLVDGAEVAIEP
jgi:UDP:flavonoid glycosyltransferase YjiC (YdhE family)